MSNNLKIADLSNLTYKVIYDSTLTSTAIVDVTQGSGYLYSIAVANTDSNDAGTLKICLSATSVTVGGNNGTPPDIEIGITADTTTKIQIPGWVAFSKLSLWQATGPQDAANTSSSTAFAVYLVTS